MFYSGFLVLETKRKRVIVKLVGYKDQSLAHKKSDPWAAFFSILNQFD